MTTLQNGDSFLVQRTDSQSGISTNYQVSQENLMANLADDDLLLVQRTSAGISTNYSITGSALKEDLSATTGLIRPPVAVLTPLNGAGITEFDQYEPLSSVITAVGEAGTIAKDTDNIQSVAAAIIPQTWTSTDGNSFTGPLEVGSYLQSLGVTAITGIKLYMDSVSGFPYTAELTSLTIDGNDYESQNSVTPTNITGTPYNSQYSFESFFSTASSYGSVQGTSNYSCNFSAISFSTSVEINFATLGGRISVYDQNGREHFVVGPSGPTVLSFPTNTNFSGLSVGQLLQSEYATLDPNKSGNFTLSNGNLNYQSNSQYTSAYSDLGKTSGKWYFEAHLTQYVADAVIGISADIQTDTYIGSSTSSYGYEAAVGAKIDGSNGFQSTGYETYTTDDIISCAFDADNGKIYFAKNGVWQESGNPENGTNPAFSNLTGSTYYFGVTGGNGGTWTVNFGATPFTYSLPSGYLGLGEHAEITAIDASAPSSQEEIVYATLDPDRLLGSSTLSNGNLDGSTTSAEGGIYATIGVSSGKWFWEITCTNDGGMIGVGDQAYPANNWHNGTGGMFYYYYNGTKYYDSNQSASYGSSYGAGDVIGVALDMDNGALYFYKNGVVQNSGTAAFTGLTGKTIMPFIQDGAGSGFNFSANFGQNAWTHEPPSGYVGLSETETTYTYPSVTVSGGTWDTSDQSQVWSSNITGTIRTPEKAFNGVIGDHPEIATAHGGEEFTINFSTPISGALEIRGGDYGGAAGTAVATCSDGTVFSIGSALWPNFQWFGPENVSNVTSIAFTQPNGGGISLSAIRLDGKLLVDPVEDSQVWSNGTYTGTAANNNYGVTDLFANVGKAGDPFVANTMWGLYQATATFTLDNPIPLTSNSTLELITYQSSSSSGSITLTGSAGSLVPTLTVNGGNVFGKTTVSDPYASLGGSITAITIAASGADWTALEGIIIDGKPVIDAGIRDLGDKKISSRTPYETSLTFTDDAELANMVAPLEMADATGGNSLTPTTSNVVSTSFTPSASFFNATTYTGNNSVNVQNFITGVDIQNNGGMIWFKNRTSGQAARILDTHRGTRLSLIPSSTTSGSNLGADGLTFNDDGFSIGWTGGDIASSNNYVAWSFREAPGFFDIVTWTGDGSSSREIPHNLGTVPGMILVKRTNDNDDWQVYHKSLGATKSLQLNQNYAESTVSDRWYDTEPTSTVFTVANTSTNSNGKTFIAYVFADNPSTQIKCGSYLGNATGGGTPAVPNQIECGFRPKFLLIKNAGNTSPWLIFDDKRADRWLYADEPDSEGSGGHIVFNDTGFSLPTGLHYVNQDNLEHIFMAIGEAGSPDTTELTFQDNTSLSALTSGMTVTSNAASTGLSFSTTIYSGNSTHTGSGAEQVITTGVDNTQKSMIWFKNRSGSSDHIMFDTLRTPPDHRWLTPNKNWAEIDGAAVLKDRTTSGFTVVHPTSGSGVAATNPNSNEPDMVSWNFRAEPGFFDIVTWDGNNTNREIAHNLGSVPGFIMIKRYSGNEDWTCYHKSLGATNYMQLNGTARSTNFSLIFNNTEPTSTHFTVGTHDRVNTTGHSYIAYVFADNPSKGIKCGVYSGNSSAQTIDTGFKTGWVMVKQSTNDYKDWVIVDNVRGGGSGNTGKGLAANGDGQEFGTNLDFVSTGFELFDGSSEVNTSGQDYIYIAIAANPILLGAQATGSLTADADPSTNTASVAAASWPTGDSVTGPSVSASLTSILEISGNTIFGDGSAGTWAPGYYAEGSQINAAPPAPSEVTFTSTDNGTTPVSMIDATLSTRTWTLESGTTATGPWTLVDSYSDFDAIDSQDGATPWTTTKPTLQPNTYYRIKVRYDSLNADSVESVYNTFKTGDA